MCSNLNRLSEAILMKTHNIPVPFSMYKKKIIRNYLKSAAKGFFS